MPNELFITHCSMLLTSSLKFHSSSYLSLHCSWMQVASWWAHSSWVPHCLLMMYQLWPWFGLLPFLLWLHASVCLCETLSNTRAGFKPIWPIAPNWAPHLRGPCTRAYGLLLFGWDWHTTWSIKHQSSGKGTCLDCEGCRFESWPVLISFPC